MPKKPQRHRRDPLNEDQAAPRQLELRVLVDVNRAAGSDRKIGLAMKNKSAKPLHREDKSIYAAIADEYFA